MVERSRVSVGSAAGADFASFLAGLLAEAAWAGTGENAGARASRRAASGTRRAGTGVGEFILVVGEVSSVQECGEQKKAAPRGATLFKEANWRESEGRELGAASGEETNGERWRNLNGVFQRLRPLRYRRREHLRNQNGKGGTEMGRGWGSPELSVS